MAFTIVATANLQAWRLDPGNPPGDNFDLTHWYLGLPIDSSGGTTGISASISAADLVAGYTNALYFYTESDGAMVFWAPVDGATTSGSSYPRSELREQIVPGNNNINWSGYGTHILDAQCKVTQIPSTEKVIIGQIHSKTGNARPLVKLLYDGSKNPNRVRALVKQSPDGENVDINFNFPNVALNGTIDYTIRMQDGLVTMTVNGDAQSTNVFASDADWADQEFYFKAGSYCQDNGGGSSEGSRVAFYSLTASHAYGNQYDLTVASPYGTPTPAVGTTAYDDGTLINASVPDSPLVSGTTRHVVTGWSGTGDVSGGSGASTSFNLTQDSSITWLWQTQYWLDTEANTGGAVDIADDWYNAGVGVTITATPDPGHQFVNWTGDSSSTNPVLNLTMNAPKAVTANFAIDTFTITASAGENGSITPAGPVVVDYGLNVEFAITAAAGYHVADVLVDLVSVGQVTSYTLYNVTSNHTIDAAFALDPSLNIAVVGDDVVLSWPTDGNAEFDLESVTSITSTVWSAAGAPTVVGDHYFVTNPAAGSDAYYRLRR